MVCGIIAQRRPAAIATQLHPEPLGITGSIPTQSLLRLHNSNRLAQRPYSSVGTGILHLKNPYGFAPFTGRLDGRFKKAFLERACKSLLFFKSSSLHFRLLVAFVSSKGIVN